MKKGSGKRKWLILIVLMGLLIFGIAMARRSGGPEVRIEKITLGDFREMVKQGEIKEVITISGNTITWDPVATEEIIIRHEVYNPGDVDELIKFLDEYEVRYNFKTSSVAWSILALFLPILLFLGIYVLIMRLMVGGMAGGNKKAKRYQPPPKHRIVNFDNVAGIDEAKEELQEVIDFLKNPAPFSKTGARAPKGVLLVGPPGCGKTLLARAVAGEADVPFLHTSGSEFIEIFVGVGARRVRGLFDQAKRIAPCIIFIDELDAIGGQRIGGFGGNSEHTQTITQIFNEMDGFKQNSGVIVMAATNRPDVLDPAIVRPGRFDRHVIVPMPDVKAREGILKVHTKGKPLTKDVDLKVLARGTPGFSGADLENLANEAAIVAAREKKVKVSMVHFEKSKDRLMMGRERKSSVISDEDRKITAYHESGHALTNVLLTPHTDPLHKVSIIPRGVALGVTVPLPERDIYIATKEQLVAKVKVYLGGRVAEEMIFGPEKITTGASNDLKILTEIVEHMVCELGMSSLGTRTFGKPRGSFFLNNQSSLGRERNFSEATAREIDDEICKIIGKARSEVETLLKKNKAALKRLARELLEKETLDGKEVGKIIKNKPSPVKAKKVTKAKEPKEKKSKK